MANPSVEQRLAQLEQRLRHMEQRLAEQDKTIQAKDQQIAELSGDKSDTGWWSGVEMSGLVELEAAHTDNQDMTDADDNDSASDANVATVELGIEAQINDWTNANLILLWEEEDGGNNDLTVDEATITLGNAAETPFYFSGGRMVAPFGAFETHMVSDPFTLELGETKETVLLLGYAGDGLAGSLYTFNGDVDSGNDTINDIGAHLAYSVEGQDSALVLGLSYLSNLADADGITDEAGLNTLADDVAGVGVNAGYRHGPFSLIGEYVGATDNFLSSEIAFKSQGAQPSAWHTEIAYSFDGIANGATVALAYQKTGEAVALGFPESRWSAGLSIDLMENTSLNLEWAHDEAYNQTDGGTGQDANTATAQLAVEF